MAKGCTRGGGRSKSALITARRQKCFPEDGKRKTPAIGSLHISLQRGIAPTHKFNVPRSLQRETSLVNMMYYAQRSKNRLSSFRKNKLICTYYRAGAKVLP